jgi:hypothetical protein
VPARRARRRLADFGIAARVPATLRGGTPMFAAPEVRTRCFVFCDVDVGMWMFLM